MFAHLHAGKRVKNEVEYINTNVEELRYSPLESAVCQKNDTVAPPHMHAHTRALHIDQKHASQKTRTSPDSLILIKYKNVYTQAHAEWPTCLG